MSVPWFIPPQQTGLSALADGFGQGFTSGRKRYEDNVANQTFGDVFDRAPAPQTTLGTLGQIVQGGGLASPPATGASGALRTAMDGPQGSAAETPFLNSLIGTESGGRWNAQNSVAGAGGHKGHFGRLQFGQARLQEAMNAGVIPAGTSPQAFMSSPESQRAVENWHFADIDRQSQRLGLDRYIGQTVGGAVITQDAIRAMAHLGGIGGAKRFLESGGRSNPSDAYGTSLRDYAIKHGGAGRPQQGVQVASTDGSGPSAATMDALMSGVNTSSSSRGEAPSAPMQAAQTPAPYQGIDIGGLISTIAAGQSSGPNVTGEQLRMLLRSEETRPLAMALWQDRVTGDPRAAERALSLALDLEQQNYGRYRDQVGDARFAENQQYERGRDAVSDQRWQQEFDARNTRTNEYGFTNVGGTLVRTNPQSGAVEPVFSQPASADPAFRNASPEEAAQYGAAAGQFGPDGRFYPINPPSGMSVEVGADGVTRVVQGPGAGKPGGSLTEGQSKDTVYATRAEGSLPLIDQYEGALTSRTDAALGAIPMGLGRDYQNTDFQLAQQAGDEFLQAILRKDTGAAITADEQTLYGNTYLPRPGDSAELIAQKRQSRLRALEAIKAGLPPLAIVQQELALRNSNSPQPAGAITAGPSAGTPGNPIQLDTVTIPAGVDPADWEFMSPEERALFQ